MFKWLLFDADNTLLDFSKASKDALWKTLEDHDRECNDGIFAVYKHVNAKVWTEFEQGKISALVLRKRRFEWFFNEIGEKDLEPARFNEAYLENVIELSETYEGVPEILQSLKKEYKISIVTNGLKEVQRPRLEKLNLLPLFDSVIVSDEIGVAKPHIDYFHHVYESISNPPSKEETLIVGDNLKSDILGGLNFGIKTCWLHHGKDNDTDIEPHFSIPKVHHLDEILGD
jgi:5'-nucleotidase